MTALRDYVDEGPVGKRRLPVLAAPEADEDEDDDLDGEEREDDEAMASLLGILWEAELGQPALASFLDQNWLEGLERSAAAHFTAVLRRLVAADLWRCR